MLISRAIAKMRAKLAPASRAATQFRATVTSRDEGTTPFTAPANAVGRLFGLMGLTSSALAAFPKANVVTNTTATEKIADRRERMRTARIQAGARRRVTPPPTGRRVAAAGVVGAQNSLAKSNVRQRSGRSRTVSESLVRGLCSTYHA